MEQKNNVLTIKIKFAGSGDYFWRKPYTSKEPQEAEVKDYISNTYSKFGFLIYRTSKKNVDINKLTEENCKEAANLEVVDFRQMKKQYGDLIDKDAFIWRKFKASKNQINYTIPGPQGGGIKIESLGIKWLNGIRNSGDFSIEKNIQNAIKVIVSEIEKQAKILRKKIKIIVKGHSRGGVAATNFVNKIAYLTKKYKGKIELYEVAFDPVPGPGNDDNDDYKYNEIDLNEEVKGAIILAIDSNHPIGFAPQKVYKTKVKIISRLDAKSWLQSLKALIFGDEPLGHGVGLDHIECFYDSETKKVLKARKHCYYLKSKFKNHEEVEKRWSVGNNKQLDDNIKKENGIYSPGQLYKLEPGLYWVDNFILEKIDIKLLNSKDKIQKIVEIINKEGQNVRKNFIYDLICRETICSRANCKDEEKYIDDLFKKIYKIEDIKIEFKGNKEKEIDCKLKDKIKEFCDHLTILFENLNYKTIKELETLKEIITKVTNLLNNKSSIYIAMNVLKLIDQKNPNGKKTGTIVEYILDRFALALDNFIKYNK